jgi:hypothetical protein
MRFESFEFLPFFPLRACTVLYCAMQMGSAVLVRSHLAATHQTTEARLRFAAESWVHHDTRAHR